MEIALLIVSFFFLLAIGVPVGWALGVAGILVLFTGLDPAVALTTYGQQFMVSLDSFTLLAIPFFILAGQIMNRGGIAHRLINFAKSLIGSLPGGLAQINVVAAMLLGAIAGSAVAAASAIGSILAPRMEQEGYSKEFGAAVNITSSSMGLVIPPSNILIIYSLASGGTSIAALFLAGYVPGILTGLILMTIAYSWAKPGKFPVGERTSLKTAFSAFVTAIPSLLLLFIVIGGIVAGIFTATEAAAIAVLYCLVLAFIYREIKVTDLPDILVKATSTTAIVMLLIAASVSMSWVMSFEGIPQEISSALLGLSDNKIVILLTINLILLVVGMFMDMTPAVLIFTPIFLHVVTELGVDPVHFGIMMIMNRCIGICTPPVGTLLFVGVSVAQTTITRVLRPLLPLFGGMVVALLLITFWPTLSTWLPELFGLM